MAQLGFALVITQIGKVRTMNPQYDVIGKAFVQQYYAMFDDPVQRPNLLSLYNAEGSLLTFEGAQHMGSAKIMEKFSALTFQKIQHHVTTVDCQPMWDGGILINVLGQLKTDDDPPHSFSHTFILKPSETSFFVQHEMFRLNLHS
ncbi:unnamed protein product [Darwinula stevensoni]|uniref:NTF2-related export protein n=1 Tax=Darwinula stevensoni TaxID=69355 RepID=A0A7R8X666_9CRUS|nr:unnamed protein product [Darwinula stevensoni]CAG0887303.1 unnamed protein product [Darwinula stevensoni]